MYRRTVVCPRADACRSSASSRRPAMPRPRCGRSTHMRRISPVLGGQRLEHAAAGGLAVEAREQEQVLGGGGQRARGVERLLEALGQLGEVVAQAPARVGRAGVLGRDRRPSRSPAGGGPRPALRRSRARWSASSGASVAAASSSEMRSSSAISARPAAVSVSRLVRRSAGFGSFGDEPVALERAQQAREVAGVEPEPRADVARRGARRRRSRTGRATRRAAGGRDSGR